MTRTLSHDQPISPQRGHPYQSPLYRLAPALPLSATIDTTTIAAHHQLQHTLSQIYAISEALDSDVSDEDAEAMLASLTMFQQSVEMKNKRTPGVNILPRMESLSSTSKSSTPSSSVSGSVAKLLFDTPSLTHQLTTQAHSDTRVTQLLAEIQRLQQHQSETQSRHQQSLELLKKVQSQVFRDHHAQSAQRELDYESMLSTLQSQLSDTQLELEKIRTSELLYRASVEEAKEKIQLLENEMSELKCSEHAFLSENENTFESLIVIIRDKESRLSSSLQHYEQRMAGWKDKILAMKNEMITTMKKQFAMIEELKQELANEKNLARLRQCEKVELELRFASLSEQFARLQSDHDRLVSDTNQSILASQRTEASLYALVSRLEAEVSEREELLTLNHYRSDYSQQSLKQDYESRLLSYQNTCQDYQQRIRALTDELDSRVEQFAEFFLGHDKTEELKALRLELDTVSHRLQMRDTDWNVVNTRYQSLIAKLERQTQTIETLERARFDSGQQAVVTHSSSPSTASVVLVWLFGLQLLFGICYLCSDLFPSLSLPPSLQSINRR